MCSGQELLHSSRQMRRQKSISGSKFVHSNGFALRSLQCNLHRPESCDKNKSFKFAPKGKPGFHAEWLRDEPCDATTTCPRKAGAWCQLLPGDGEHEIRGLLQHSLL